MICISEGQTILHQVADQAADRDPFTRLKISEAPEKTISLVDARENELILSGAKYGRVKVSLSYLNSTYCMLHIHSVISDYSNVIE